MICCFKGALWLLYQHQTLEVAGTKLEALLQQSSGSDRVSQQGAGGRVVNGIWMYFEGRGSVLLKQV